MKPHKFEAYLDRIRLQHAKAAAHTACADAIQKLVDDENLRRARAIIKRENIPITSIRDLSHDQVGSYRINGFAVVIMDEAVLILDREDKFWIANNRRTSTAVKFTPTNLRRLGSSPNEASLIYEILTAEMPVLAPS